MKRLLAVLLVCMFCFNTLTVQAAKVKTYHIGDSKSEAASLGTGKSTIYLDECEGYIKYKATKAGTYVIKIYDLKCLNSHCTVSHRPMALSEALGERYKKKKDCTVDVNYNNEAQYMEIDDEKKMTFTCKMKKGDVVYVNMDYWEACKFTVNISKKKK